MFNAANEVAVAAFLDGQIPFGRISEIIERLMCDFAVDVADLARRHGRALAEVDAAWPRLLPFQLDGLAEVGGSVVTVTDLGRPFVRAVCAAFDPAAVDIEKRHARVV